MTRLHGSGTGGTTTSSVGALGTRTPLMPYVVLVLVCGILAGAAALAFVYLTGPQYTSTATLLLSPRLSVDPNADTDSARALETEVRVLNSGAVLAPVAREIGSSVSELRSDFEATPVTNTRLILISAEGSDPEAAKEKADRVVAAYRAYRVEAQNQEVSEYAAYIAGRLARISEARSRPGSSPVGSTTDAALEAERTRLLTDLEVVRSVGRSATGGVSVTDPPSLPEKTSYYTSAARTLALAVALGMVIGAAVAVQRILTSDVVFTPRDVEAQGGPPVLADFRHPHRGRRRPEPSVELITRTASATEVAAARRHIALRTAQRVVVAGLGDPDTTAYAAMRLAAGVASTGTAVLLICADPSAESFLGDVDLDESGLAAVAAGRAGFEDVLSPGQRLGVPNLSVVAPGAGSDPVTLLSAEKTRVALEQASGPWQLVVIACSAVDAPLVAAAVDACVLAVPAGGTGRRELDRAVHDLEQQEVPVLGALLVPRESRRARRQRAASAKRRTTAVRAAPLETGA
jgi:capsular polysaccharide biosynthesis protein/Mrp family chromosome partitioning ATPase